MALDPATGRGTDAATYDPARHRVSSANGIDGTLTVISQDSPNAYHVAPAIDTAITARTMAIDPRLGHRRDRARRRLDDPWTGIRGRHAIFLAVFAVTLTKTHDQGGLTFGRIAAIG